MIWLTSPNAIATALPAVWVVATGARPADLGERSALRRGIGRDILRRQLGDPDATIAHDDQGRPWPATADRRGLHLSLATRAGFVAVALAERPVGVDVEAMDRGRPIPNAVLHPDEREDLAKLPPARRPEAFMRLWAAKEAYVKALGTGFVREPASFAIRPLSESRFRVDDPAAPTLAIGHLRAIENGGQDILAAAVIVLD